MTLCWTPQRPWGAVCRFRSKPRQLTVGELFSGSNVFRMPIFQRPYSWDEETALELYDDIDQMLNEPLATFWVQ